MEGLIIKRKIKSVLACLLALCLVFSFAACKKKDPDKQKEESADVRGLIVSNRLNNSFKDSAGIERYKISFLLPVFKDDTSPCCETLENINSNIVSLANAQGNTFSANGYIKGADCWVDTANYKVLFEDDKYINILITEKLNKVDHTETIYYSAVIDLTTGEKCEIKQFSSLYGKEDKTVNDVFNAISADIFAKLQNDYLATFELDFKMHDNIDEKFVSDYVKRNPHNFFLTDTGICYFFEARSTNDAPYPLEVNIPFNLAKSLDKLPNK